MWERLPVIPVLRRLRQEDHKLEASLGYPERTYLKRYKIKQNKETRIQEV
jgi:hypothetical protein